MNPSKLHKRVKEEIKKAHKKPLPRWLFALRNDIFWALLALSIGIGSATASILVYLVEQEELDVYMYQAFHDLNSFTIFVLLPLIWLGILVMLAAITAFNARHTKKGYRWSKKRVTSLSLGLSVIIGILLHMAGWSESFDTTLKQNIPPYRQLRELRMDVWSNPEAGMLSGTVDFIDADYIVVTDFKGLPWHVDIASVPHEIMKRIFPGMPVRVTGVITDLGQFLANDIRPWRGGFLPRFAPHLNP